MQSNENTIERERERKESAVQYKWQITRHDQLFQKTRKIMKNYKRKTNREMSEEKRSKAHTNGGEK